MMLNIKAVNVLNPRQTPVETSDFPVYALTKEAIYCFPDKFIGYSAIIGGLLIEQGLLEVRGYLVDDSSLKEQKKCWTCSLATTGVSVVVDVNQIKRTLFCIQTDF